MRYAPRILLTALLLTLPVYVVACSTAEGTAITAADSAAGGGGDSSAAGDATTTDDASGPDGPTVVKCWSDADCLKAMPEVGECRTPMCDPDTNECVLLDKDHGTECHDGNKCTGPDFCVYGECGGGPLDCSDDDPCTLDYCDLKDGCLHDPLSGVACDDGDPCSTGDVCQDGSCEGTDTIDGCCVYDGECDDGDVCTDDDCADNACDWAFNYAPCVDGDACTTGDHCDGAGGCIGQAVICDDANSCTSDACDAETGECVYDAALDGTPCDDFDTCTEPDVCQLGFCKGMTNKCECTTDADCVPFEDGDLCNGTLKCNGFVCVVDTLTVVDCNPTNDTACEENLCTKSTGQCAMKPRTNGTFCDDGDPCTQGDVCVVGECVGQAPVVGCCQHDSECWDGDPCTDDDCAMNTCAWQHNYAPCNDGDKCTQGDHCDGAGACGGEAIVCDDDNPCTADGCDSATGTCYGGPAPDGTPCEDGNSCTSPDLCMAGVCEGTDSVCECTSDGDCAAFEDGNLCNGTLRCIGNTCVVDASTVVTCNTTADTKCTWTSCDPGTGVCAPVAAVDGTSCDDQNLCTGGDQCSAGVCIGGALDCDDNNDCTFDACSPVEGCQHLPNTLPCDDGNACTANDQCDGGGCSGEAVTCEDGDVCTDDSCAASAGCLFTHNFATCDDGNSCTLGDKCSGGSCVAGPNTCQCVSDGDCAALEDGNLCNGTLKCVANSCEVDPATVVTCNTAGDTTCSKTQCDASSGQCVAQAVFNGAFCNDQNPCTWDDRCANGLCSGKPVDCDDGNLCTDDVCEPSQGCVSLNNTLPCDDDSACTTGDQCGGGVCAGNTVACDDDNVCTVDSCDADGGCLYVEAPEGYPCEDDNVCTVADGCHAGWCGGEPADCDDGNACTADTCSNPGGCQSQAVAEGTPCDDGSACTAADACLAGECGGNPVECDDGDPCSSETCDDLVGCMYGDAPDGTGCDDLEACTSNDACEAGVCAGGDFICQCQTDADCATEEDGDLCNGTLYCDQGANLCKVDLDTVVTCEQPADPCLLAVCDPAAGSCMTVEVTDDPACDATECVPECAPGQCSDNGCGTPCSECPDGETCGDSGQCEACFSDCFGKVCGSDGCNGSCGICDPGSSCNATGTACISPCAACPSGDCAEFDFEGGDGITGWDISGDVAVIGNLGSTPPPQGSKMLRLSTGLSFAAPSYAQRALCVEGTPSTLSFQWKFYSEEFLEFCGSQYQDYFLVRIVIDGVATDLLYLEIDHLCPPEECSGCGSAYFGIEASDVDFDQWGAFVTPWKTSTITLPPDAGDGTLIFEVADTGDSSWDTVVILDDIVLSD